MATERDVVHVAIAPPKTLETDVAKKVATIVGKEPYDTRLLLVGEVPRILTHCDSMQEAESVAQGLGGLGLVAFICRDSDLRRTPQSLSVRTMKFGEGEVLFLDRSGLERTTLGTDDTFLIIKGKAQGYVEEESTRTKMKFSKAATVMTGGIPVWRPATEKTTSQSLREEGFARLYNRESSEPSVEILVNHMDYSFLGSEMAASSPANFNTVVAKLREVFQEALFDDRLMRPFKVDVPSSGLQDDLEINCKLIYMYHLTVSRLGSL
jgi:hypothetical protein